MQLETCEKISKSVKLLRVEKNLDEGFNLISEIMNDIVDSLTAHINENDASVDIALASVKQLFEDMNTAMNEFDIVLLCDILQFELPILFSHMQSEEE